MSFSESRFNELTDEQKGQFREMTEQFKANTVIARNLMNRADRNLQWSEDVYDLAGPLMFTVVVCLLAAGWGWSSILGLWTISLGFFVSTLFANRAETLYIRAIDQIETGYDIVEEIGKIGQ